MAGSSSGTDGNGSDWHLFRIGTFEHPLLIPLDRNEVVVGRISNKHLKKSPFVSRKHVCFFKSDDNWHVEDLGSTNGTYVNSIKINSNCLHPVRESDVVGLGMATATSEERFSFMLCKNAKIKGKCEVISNFCANEFSSVSCKSNVKGKSRKRLGSDTTNSDYSIETYVESGNSDLNGSRLSTLDASDTRLTESELNNSNNPKLPRTSHVQNKNSNPSSDFTIINARDVPVSKTPQTTSTSKTHISNPQNFLHDCLHFKSIFATKGSVLHISGSNTNNIKSSVDKMFDKQKISPECLGSSKSTLKRCINEEKIKTSQACKIQKVLDISDYSVAKEYQKISENMKCTSKIIDKASETVFSDSLQEPLKRKSVCSNQLVNTMQNKSKLVDKSTTDKKFTKTIDIDLEFKNQKKDYNIITVPDDDVSIIESIEIKDELIIVSDCDDDDDCVVIDNECNKSIPDSDQYFNQFTNVKNNDIISQPSISNNCNSTNSITGNSVEVDESSNDTHFSETVDDCVEFEIVKPDLNIDESKLLSRISWPELPAD